jgi:fructuronate reductase
VRLGEATLDRLPADIARFAYDRAAQAAGIVHFGIGAFHRAHQAWYTDRAMDGGERDWTIVGVSLRSGDVAALLNPQDGLYTVTQRSSAGETTRLVGAVREVLVAPHDPQAVIAALAAPETRIVSLTITEKGYCRTAQGDLDPQRADDGSAFHYLGQGLRRRREAGLPGLTLLSCDNLADNGRQLDRLLQAYLDLHDPALLGWFAAECACPATMVDRIVPATTAEDRTMVSDMLDGLVDEAAVLTEPFSQWVIEDRFAGSRPRWEAVGAELVADVAPYEAAKLRMLNGAHSALAYIGLARGHAFVHEAVADPQIRPLVERLMREEAAPSIAAAPGQDLAVYADLLLARFANPALAHRLAQIAIDGSQKIPQRWLATLACHQRAGRQCPAILTALAAWLRHVRGDNGPVDDPLAVPLRAAWDRVGEAGIVPALFAPGGLLASAWQPSPVDRRHIEAHLVAAG